MVHEVMNVEREIQYRRNSVVITVAIVITVISVVDIATTIELTPAIYNGFI